MSVLDLKEYDQTNKTTRTYEGNIARDKSRCLEFVPDPAWAWTINVSEN